MTGPIMGPNVRGESITAILPPGNPPEPESITLVPDSPPVVGGVQLWNPAFLFWLDAGEDIYEDL